MAAPFPYGSRRPERQPPLPTWAGIGSSTGPSPRTWGRPDSGLSGRGRARRGVAREQVQTALLGTLLPGHREDRGAATALSELTLDLSEGPISLLSSSALPEFSEPCSPSCVSRSLPPPSLVHHLLALFACLPRPSRLILDRSLCVCTHWLRAQERSGQPPCLDDAGDICARSIPQEMESLAHSRSPSRLRWFLPPSSPLILSETVSFLFVRLGTHPAQGGIPPLQRWLAATGAEMPPGHRCYGGGGPSRRALDLHLEGCACARGKRLQGWVRLGDAEHCFCASKKPLGASRQRKGTSYPGSISMYRNLSPPRTQTRNRKGGNIFPGI